MMITKQENQLENLLDKQVSLKEKTVLPRIDAANILANLNNAPEVGAVQVSLEALKSAVTSGDKAKLIEMMAIHAALLSALSERLLADASSCKSEKLTVTIIELALKSFDCTRRTLLATNDLASAPAPVVAVQINNA